MSKVNKLHPSWGFLSTLRSLKPVVKKWRTGEHQPITLCKTDPGFITDHFPDYVGLWVRYGWNSSFLGCCWGKETAETKLFSVLYDRYQTTFSLCLGSLCPVILLRPDQRHCPLQKFHERHSGSYEISKYSCHRGIMIWFSSTNLLPVPSPMLQPHRFLIPSSILSLIPYAQEWPASSHLHLSNPIPFVFQGQGQRFSWFLLRRIGTSPALCAFPGELWINCSPQTGYQAQTKEIIYFACLTMWCIWVWGVFFTQHG